MSLIPFELPRAECLFPAGVKEERSRLLAAFKEEQENPNLRRKIELLSRAFMLFAVQITLEDNARVAALSRIRQIRESRLLEQASSRAKELSNG